MVSKRRYESAFKKKSRVSVLWIYFYKLIVVITILDYINMPTLLSMNISKYKLGFLYVFYILAIIAMYVIAYKLLDKRAVKKEKNKKDISILYL